MRITRKELDLRVTMINCALDKACLDFGYQLEAQTYIGLTLYLTTPTTNSIVRTMAYGLTHREMYHLLNGLRDGVSYLQELDK